MEKLERFVSIIISADIVGYTTMMQHDESNALLKISRYEKSIQDETIKYDGEIIKNYGDGSLILFSSAVKAVQCAIAIQQDLITMPSVPLRIGIHIGEIVRKGNDIFGNGVNIAARIESMGTANSILISADVYNQIKNQSEFETNLVGSFSFKNVDHDISLYAITNGELTIPLKHDMNGKGSLNKKVSFWGKWKKAIVFILLSILICVAVIYRVSFYRSPKTVELTSNYEALDFFLKGEHHHRLDRRTNIDSAISFYHKAIEKDPKFAIAYSKLAGAYMRKNLFFDPNIKWEDEAYAAAGKALFFNSELADPHVIRGQFYWSQSHNFAHEEAINEYLKAIEKDPKLSFAYEQLALVQVHIGLYGEALKNAQRSLEIDPGNFKARRIIAEVFLFQGDYKTSLKEFEKIPDNFALPNAQSLYALNLYYLHQTEKAVDILNERLIKDPKNPNLNSVYAILKASLKEFSAAEKHKAIAIENSKDFIHVHHIYYHLGITSALMNNKEEACKWLTKAAETGFPNYPLFNADPSFTILKGYPAFEELLKDLEEKYEHYKTL